MNNIYLTANIDGYFQNWPASSATLITRTKNRMPVMLMYPFGSGTIIATTLFTDWSYSRNQTTNQELTLIKDLLLWAKYKTDKVFPPNKEINISLSITQPATINTIDPNNNVSTYTTQGTLTLTPQTLGIWRVLYSNAIIDTFAVSKGLSYTGSLPDITYWHRHLTSLNIICCFMNL